METLSLRPEPESPSHRGVSVSDAVRMLLVRVAAEEALPFDVKIPNATVKAMRAAESGKGKRLTSAGALFRDLGI